MFRRLLFKFYLYVKGIRFYKTETIPKSPEFSKVVFETVGDHQVEFYFYREACEDLIFKRGKISKQKFIGYVIQARLDSNLPEVLYQYNNLKFFFNEKNLMLAKESEICNALLNIYLDFLRAELSK